MDFISWGKTAVSVLNNLVNDSDIQKRNSIQTPSNPYKTNNNKGAISKPFPKNFKNRNEKCLLVKFPDNDCNFEVHIKKTSSNFSNLSVKSENRTANQNNIDESRKYQINKNKTQKLFTENKTQNYYADDKCKNKTKFGNGGTNNGLFLKNKSNGQNKFTSKNENVTSVLKYWYFFLCNVFKYLQYHFKVDGIFSIKLGQQNFQSIKTVIQYVINYLNRSNTQTDRTQTFFNPYNAHNNKDAISKPFPKTFKKNTNENCLLVKVPDTESNFEVHIKKNSWNFSNLFIKPGNRSANQSNTNKSLKYQIGKNETQKVLTENKTRNYDANYKCKNKTKFGNGGASNETFLENKQNGQNKSRSMNKSGGSVQDRKNLSKTSLLCED